MKKTIFFTLLILVHFVSPLCQTTSIDLGVSARITCDFTRSKHHKAKTNFSLGVGAFIAGKNMFNYEHWRPSMSLEFIVMNGRPGSPDFIKPDSKGKATRKSHTKSFMAISLSPLKFGFGSLTSADSSLRFYNKPEYFFFDYTPNTISNPYTTSINVSTAFVYNFDSPGKKYHSWQRIILINASWKNFSGHYLNDGAAPKFICDQRDRWFTGGIILNYYNNAILGPFNSIEMTYQRFTGWTDNSYEVARDLYFTEVPYNDSTQNYYNKGEVVIRATNNQLGYGIGACFYDGFKYDLQNLIHMKKYYTYHINHLPKQYGLQVYGDLKKYF